MTDDKNHRRHLRKGKARTRILLRLLFLALWLAPTAASDLLADQVLVRQTQIGQRMPIYLSESSQLVLGGDTSVAIDDTAPAHRVILKSGELYANVHHNDDRAFEIVVGQLVLYDRGTQFVASKHDEIANVAVTEGQLQLFERGPEGEFRDPMVVEPGVHRREPAILAAGDQARVEQLSDGTLVVTRGKRDLAAAKRRMQWLEDNLDTTGWRLDELVWEFNRYNLRQIVIDDPQLASQSFGMTLHLNNVDDFTKALMTYGITVTRGGGDGGTDWSYHLRGGSRHAKERGK